MKSFIQFCKHKFICAHRGQRRDDSIDDGEGSAFDGQTSVEGSACQHEDQADDVDQCPRGNLPDFIQRSLDELDEQ